VTGWLYTLPPSPDAPHGLGRHVHHDPRSLEFAAPVLPRVALESHRWTRRAPVFDQGQTSSCVGNAAAGWIVTDNATRPGLTAVAGRVVDESYALEVAYHLATELDDFPGEYPPDDEGSSGLGAAKALKSLGLCSSYTHAFTVQALETALQSGPVLVGVTWYNSMFSPDADGVVPVDVSSGQAGGHELCVDELDLERGWVGFTNSWGVGWGSSGRGFFRFEDLASLLRDDGDCVIPAAPVAPGPPPFPSRSSWIRRLLRWLARVLGVQG
jgi:hypothetical protein